MYHDQYYNRDVTKMQLSSRIRKSLTKPKASRDTRVMNRATGGGEVINLVPWYILDLQSPKPLQNSRKG